MTPTRESDRILLIHIRDSIERIREYTDDGRDGFFGSHLIQDAVLRKLQTLAESTQRLSRAIKATEPAIPWVHIAGFRNVLVHNYLGIDLDVVWDTLQHDLTELLEAVERMIRIGEGGDAS